MAAILKLVPSTQPQQAPASQPKSHLDIAIENHYICDIHNILISPDSGQFHLSLKTDIEGSTTALWINVFGEKQYLSAKALEAIDEVLNNGIPHHPARLYEWKKEILQYSADKSNLLMLPE